MDILPSELTSHIFQYLPAIDIARFEHLNRHYGSIIRRNRCSLKHPNFSVVYSENRMSEMVLKVVSSDFGYHWKTGRILRKITLQDKGRILVVQGGDGEFPEGGEDESETISIVLRWLKENIQAAYARWGRNDIPDIPELVLENLRQIRCRLLGALARENCTIAVLRFEDCVTIPNDFIRHQRPSLVRVLIEKNNSFPSEEIVQTAQTIDDCKVYARIDLVKSLLDHLKSEWREIKHRCRTPWTVKVLFSEEKSEEHLLSDILDNIQSAEDLDFQVILSGDDKNGRKVVTVRGIHVPRNEEDNNHRRFLPAFPLDRRFRAPGDREDGDAVRPAQFNYPNRRGHYYRRAYSPS